MIPVTPLRHAELVSASMVQGKNLVGPLARGGAPWMLNQVQHDGAYGFAAVLAEAIARAGVKLLHLKTHVEHITPATTLSAIRERGRQ